MPSNAQRARGKKCTWKSISLYAAPVVVVLVVAAADAVVAEDEVVQIHEVAADVVAVLSTLMSRMPMHSQPSAHHNLSLSLLTTLSLLFLMSTEKKPEGPS